MQRSTKITREEIRKLKDIRVRKRRNEIIKSSLKRDIKSYFISLFIINFIIIYFMFHINIGYSFIYTLGINLFSLWLFSIIESRNEIQEESQKIRNSKIELK